MDPFINQETLTVVDLLVGARRHYFEQVLKWEMSRIQVNGMLSARMMDIKRLTH